MKNLTCFIMSVLLLTLALGLGTNIAMAEMQDVAKLSPDDVKVLVENDRVRVLEILHKPGAKEPMHSHPAAVSVYLSSFKLKVTSPDGKTVDRNVKEGEVKWNEALTHAVENIGSTDQHVIMIELK